MQCVHCSSFNWYSRFLCPSCRRKELTFNEIIAFQIASFFTNIRPKLNYALQTEFSPISILAFLFYSSILSEYISHSLFFAYRFLVAFTYQTKFYVQYAHTHIRIEVRNKRRKCQFYAFLKPFSLKFI